MTQITTQEQRLDFLIRYLLIEKEEYRDIEIPAIMCCTPLAPSFTEQLQRQTGNCWQAVIVPVWIWRQPTAYRVLRFAVFPLENFIFRVSWRQRLPYRRSKHGSNRIQTKSR